MSKFKNWLIPFAIAIMPCIYISDSLDPVLMPQFVLFSLLVLFLTATNSGNIIVPKSPLIICFATYFFMNVISILASINLSESIYVISKIFLELGLLIYSISWIRHIGKAKALMLIAYALQFASFFIIAAAFYQLWQAYPLDFFKENSLYVITSILANKNLFASVLFLLFPWQIYAIVKFKKAWKLFAAFNLLPSFFFIIILQTRAVWMAFILAGLVTALCFFILSIRNHRVIFSQLKRNKLVIGSILLSIIVIITFYKKMDAPVKKRIEAAFKINEIDENPHLHSYKTRLTMWEKSIKMSADHPFLGVGAGNWAIHLPKYGLDDLELETSQGIKNYNRPHNDFLWVLAETGIFGFLSYAGIFIIAIGLLIRKALSLSGEKLIYYLLLFSLCGYAFISFVDFPRERIYHNLLFLLAIAIIIEIREGNENWQISKGVSVMVVFACLLSLSIGILRLNGEIHSKKAIIAKDQGNWPLMEREARKSQSVFYNLNPMCIPVKWYEGVAAYAMQKKNEATGNFEQAYKAHPNHIHVLNNLGTCYEEQGNHRKAIEFYKKALAIAPRFEESSLNLSAVYFNLMETDSAYSIIKNAYFNPAHPRYRKYLVAILLAKLDEQAPKKKCNEGGIELIKSDEKLLLRLFEQSRNQGVDFVDLSCNYEDKALRMSKKGKE